MTPRMDLSFSGAGNVVTDFVTCLNIDHRAAMRLVVGDDCVTLGCHGMEIEMLADSVEQLISCAEQALPRLATTSLRELPDSRAVSTWVLCNPGSPPECKVLGEALELRWGPLILTINKAALPELIRRCRDAHTQLIERLTEPATANPA